jgi:hypothetical protein
VLSLKIFTGAGASGIILGVLLVWWIRPATGPGTVLIILVSLVACFLLGVVLTSVVGLFRKRQ